MQSKAEQIQFAQYQRVQIFGTKYYPDCIAYRKN